MAVGSAAVRPALERPGRMARAEPQRTVDVVLGGHALVAGPVRLVDDRQLDPLDDPVAGRRVEPLASGGYRCGILSDRPAVVRVEPGARLAPEPAGLDQPLLDRRRPEPIGQRIAPRHEALVDPARGGEGHVDAGEVHQLERAHRIARRPQPPHRSPGSLASPASSIASASSVNGRLTRLTMKPGASSATTGVLPQRSMSATARVDRIAVGLRSARRPRRAASAAPG